MQPRPPPPQLAAAWLLEVQYSSYSSSYSLQSVLASIVATVGVRHHHHHHAVLPSCIPTMSWDLASSCFKF